LSKPRKFATNGVLFEERGVRVIVYVDGNNLGVIRHGDESLRMDHAEICAVVEAAGETNEWFAHPAGFLFCRGSRKAPAENPSKVNPRTSSPSLNPRFLRYLRRLAILPAVRTAPS